jgi:8-oxo-dGTP pyrophosphatase MutT (NUDIX family)
MARPRSPYREVSAGGVVFRRLEEDGIRFLLIKDSYDKWGLPKGHIEDGETPAQAAIRETREEVGLDDLRLVGPIRIIDWRFRAKGGRLIHKYCHFFLLESPGGEPAPQLDEGITACRWCTLDDAMLELSYENARGVLRRAGEMARTLTAVGSGRPRQAPQPITPKTG